MLSTPDAFTLQLSDLRILIVEDDPVMRLGLEHLLEDYPQSLTAGAENPSLELIDDLLRGGSERDRFSLSSGRDIIQNFQDGEDLLELPTLLDGTSLRFADLKMVQTGQDTEVRWRLDGSGNPRQVQVTVLEGISVPQITVDDFVQVMA